MAGKLFETNADFPRGVVLVAHGLNNKPEVMDSLIRVLLVEGFHCNRIALHQNGPSSRTPPTALANAWIAAYSEAYDKVCHRYPGQPIHSLSYSIGALITIRFLDIRPDSTVARMVLIAPPVALTPGARLVRFLTPLARFGVVLPSAAPADVRARRGTPLAEYAAMLNQAEAVRTLERREELGSIGTRIIMDRKDELVNYEGVAAWVRRNRLSSWTVEELKDRAPEGRTYKHLMVLERSLGRLAWTQLTKDIVAHFERSG